MLKLVRNEIKLSFTKKSMIVMMMLILIVLILFQLYYVNGYNTYKYEKIYELRQEVETATIWYDGHVRRLERIEKEIPDYKGRADVEMEVEAWKNYLNYSTVLLNLYNNDVLDERDIIKIEKARDFNLINIYESDYELIYNGIYRETEREWNIRMKFWNFYDNNGIEPVMNPKRPDGMFVLFNSLSGANPIMITLLTATVFFTYDIWSRDFECEAYKLYFTLPSSRTKLYCARIISRLFLVILSLVILISILFLLGYFNYGSGFDRVTSYNIRAINSLKSINNEMNELMKGDSIIYLKDYIVYQGAIVAAYIILLFSIINIISLLTKNSTLSLLIPVLIVLIILINASMINYGGEQHLNPFNYLFTNDILSGNMIININIALVILISFSIVFILAGLFYLNRSDLNNI